MKVLPAAEHFAVKKRDSLIRHACIQVATYQFRTDPCILESCLKSKGLKRPKNAIKVVPAVEYFAVKSSLLTRQTFFLSCTVYLVPMRIFGKPFFLVPYRLKTHQ